MKILLSAYACEPNKGSEPGVGWTWATELAKKNEIWVLTRDNNRPVVETYLKENPDSVMNGVHFEYIGLPKVLTFWKKGRRGMRLYYSMWQWKAANTACHLEEKIKFDYAQHITFVSYTQQSYLYRMKVPVVWGPVAGGENIPDAIHIPMSHKERVIEVMRKLSQMVCLYMPCTQHMLKGSTLILSATEETKRILPARFSSKMFVLPAIALEKQFPETKKTNNEKIKIVMAGRLIYWKAFHLGIESFLALANDFPNVELHILGEGNQKENLKQLSGEYLNRQIFFDPPVKHDEIFYYFSNYDLFMNTTLRDSGCMTMMEAMSVGVPCVAIDAGGPGFLLKEFPECKIPPDSNAVAAMESLLRRLLCNHAERDALGKKQKAFADKELSIQYAVSSVQRLLLQRKVLKENKI